ncbi:MAG: DUF4383 domain-containing protein [Agromyces sp.]|nr:DUF4383 domain-containing protein [Agromyces sp.]
MHSVAHPSTTAKYAGTPVQVVALIFGIVFLAVGIAGFIPGLTTDVDALLFWGSDSGAMLLGLFQVSILHNVVHLLFGAAGLWLASSIAGSRNYLIWGGVVYGLILVYGLFVSGDHPANVVPVNTADNWLHGALAVAMILFGLLLGRRGRASA